MEIEEEEGFNNNDGLNLINVVVAVELQSSISFFLPSLSLEQTRSCSDETVEILKIE